MKKTVATFTLTPHKYSENETEEEIMEWVRHATSDKDALHNLRVILQNYDRRKSFWTKLKQLIK